MPACGSAAGFAFDAGFGFAFDVVCVAFGVVFLAFADEARDFADEARLASGTERPASRINRRRLESDWIRARMTGSASMRA